MQTLITVLQIVLALGLLNVWLLRFNRPTSYRGGEAKTMREEFAAYGLPSWAVYVVGSLKVASALALVVGLMIPVTVVPAAAIIAILMIGALAMHVKIRDPLLKSVPALLMLVMSSGVVYLSQNI